MTVGFGHGISVTPLHVVAGTAAVANGGVLMKPTILAIDPDDPPEGTRVMQKSTSDVMRRLMRLVVTNGFGKKAEVPGYYPGGKTGTAEKNSGHGYKKHANVSAFMSVFPMQAPRYAVYMMLDEPHGNASTGGYSTAGQVAAPAAGRVIARIGPILSVMPDTKDAPEIEQALAIPMQPPRGMVLGPIKWSSPIARSARRRCSPPASRSARRGRTCCTGPRAGRWTTPHGPSQRVPPERPRRLRGLSPSRAPTPTPHRRPLGRLRPRSSPHPRRLHRDRRGPAASRFPVRADPTPRCRDAAPVAGRAPAARHAATRPPRSSGASPDPDDRRRLRPRRDPRSRASGFASPNRSADGRLRSGGAARLDLSPSGPSGPVAPRRSTGRPRISRCHWSSIGVLPCSLAISIRQILALPGPSRPLPRVVAGLESAASRPTAGR